MQTNDVEAVRSLLRQEAEHNGIFSAPDSPYHPDNAAVATVKATLDKNDVNCGWLAFSDDKPAGIITTPQNLPGGVFVYPKFRKMGIAQILVRERERYFKETLGLTKIERPVLAGNKASIKLHTEKLGYQFSASTLFFLAKNPEPPETTILFLTKNL